MPRKVVRFGDCSKVNASVVRRSSTRPMISMGCIDELIWEVTDTTGVLVETDILTIAVESLDVLTDRPRAAQKMDEHCGRFARVGEETYSSGCGCCNTDDVDESTAHDRVDHSHAH